MSIEKQCDSIVKESNKFIKICSMLNVQNEATSLYENMLISKVIDDNIDDLVDGTGDVYNRLNDIPYFSPEEMEDFKDYYTKSTLRYLDEKEKVTLKEWKNDYLLFYNGIITENHNKYAQLWTNKLYELYSEMTICDDPNRLNAIKQDILDLGWNPNIPFNVESKVKVTKLIREDLKRLNDKPIYDITNFLSEISDEPIQESHKDLDRYPVYIVLTYTGTGFGRLINKYTKGVYSHAAIGLDSDLERLYSFNLKQNGFSVESLSGYISENDESIMAVYTIFVSKKDHRKIKTKLDYFLLNKKKTKYSILNILGLLVNKPVEMANDMICSQFVDYILKSVDIDMTNKSSGLVTPNDLYMALNPRIYKLYEGKMVDYDYKKLDKLKDLLINKPKTITESMMQVNNESTYISSLYENKNNLSALYALYEHSDIVTGKNKVLYEYLKPYIDIDYVTEAKEFPVQFDKEGNLLIRKIKHLDCDYEYFQSHKLLIAYEENRNIEGMKYELSKLWFLNQILEKKIYSENNKDTKSGYHKSRARILNDFNKYLKIVLSIDKDFVFTDYYNDSPFSDAVIKINQSTLHHGAKLVKNMGKLLLR